MSLPTKALAWIHTGELGRDVPIDTVLRLEERSIPKLAFGMALVKVLGAPVNPSDLMYLRGLYGVKPKAGEIPGFEGCGRVLAANAGPYGWWLKGKLVSFGSQEGYGSWAQYVVIPVFSAIPVRRDLPIPCAATLIVNPMTAIGLMKRARSHRTSAIVVNAAGSALGQNLLALAKQDRIKFIGLVRRQESVASLRRLGADHVFVTSEEGFLDRFAAVCRDCNARVLFDAVAGKETAQLVKAMPDTTLTVVYGQLSEEFSDSNPNVSLVSMDADSLVFRRHRVEGYWLTHELHGFSGVFTPLIRARKISKLYKQKIFDMPNFTEVSLQEIGTALRRPAVNRGKVIYLNPE